MAILNLFSWRLSARIGVWIRSPLTPALMAWLCATLLGLVPPFSRDALNSHLLLPALWREHGMFWRDDWLSFTASPPLGDLFYLLVAGIRWDIAASAIHAIGALLALLMLRRALHHLNCLLSTQRLMLLLWVTIPTVTVLCTWSYVDLWLCAATAACVMLITAPNLRGLDGWWLGIAFAAALLTKYNGGAVVVAAALAIAWRVADRPALLLMIGWRATLVTMVAFVWWYGGNFLTLGNFLYPLGEGFAGIPWMTHRQLIYHESFWWALLAPLRMFFWGETNNPVLFDGMLSPLLLLGLLIGWRARERVPPALLIGAVTYLLIALSSASRARYLLPATLFLLPLTAIALERYLRPRYRLMIIVVVIVLSLFNSGRYFFWLAPWDYWLHGRDTFLSERLHDYPIQHWIAKNISPDAHIFLLWMGGRGYYLHHPFSYRMGREESPLPPDLADHFDYLLFHVRATKRSLTTEEWSKLRSRSCPVVISPPFALWRLQPCKNSGL